LLLAVRGHPGSAPTIGDVADHLLLRHHSVVGLVDRAVAAGHVERQIDAEDHRVVRLRLTPSGTRRLAALATAHVDELDRLGPIFAELGRSTTAT
jgi:DNA-binding MarR family transcriptional regulator